MDAIEQMLHRRSVRAFRPEMPDRELIDRVIEAGTYAANGRNHQAGLILAITNKQVRDQLSAMNAKIMGTDTDPFYVHLLCWWFWQTRTGRPMCMTVAW